MAAERLSMRKTREVLRLKAAGQRNRAIAGSLAIGRSTVGEYLTRARAAGISWPLPAGWTEVELEARLYPPPQPSNVVRPLPDWGDVQREMKACRRTGVTLQLLWIEYKERCPEGLQYSQFCEHYRRWREALDLVLRQEHRAGEKVFVDFAGQTVPVVDRATGEVREAQVFVGVLGASRSCTTTAASRPTRGGTRRVASPPIPPTGPRRTRGTSSGRLHASSPGPRRPAPVPES